MRAAGLSRDFIFQTAALVLTVVVVHALFVGVVRPQAREAATVQEALLAVDPGAEVGRSVWIVLRDPEQEICFILLIWGLILMGDKMRRVFRERAMLARELVPLATGETILPEDARDHARAIEALDSTQRASLYARALHVALRRFAATRDLQNVSESVDSVCQAEHERLDSELAMVRYMAWAIPSIGFIGTVRGIGQALSLAHEAVEGNITGVTASLGTAFNSTFVALLLSIVLMFVLYQLQEMQERLVLDTRSAADEKLIEHLQVR